MSLEETLKAIREARLHSVEGPSAVYIGVKRWAEIVSRPESLLYIDYKSDGFCRISGLRVFTVNNDVYHLKVI